MGFVIVLFNFRVLFKSRARPRGRLPNALPLPAYPFEGGRYWIGPKTAVLPVVAAAAEEGKNAQAEPQPVNVEPQEMTREQAMQLLQQILQQEARLHRERRGRGGRIRDW